jgi:hypothetical protein
LLQSEKKKDIFIGAVYIPPATSAVHQHGESLIIQEIQAEIDGNLAIGDVLVLGDWNARFAESVICLPA